MKIESTIPRVTTLYCVLGLFVYDVFGAFYPLHKSHGTHSTAVHTMIHFLFRVLPFLFPSCLFCDRNSTSQTIMDVGECLKYKRCGLEIECAAFVFFYSFFFLNTLVAFSVKASAFFKQFTWQKINAMHFMHKSFRLLLF